MFKHWAKSGVQHKSFLAYVKLGGKPSCSFLPLFLPALPSQYTSILAHSANSIAECMWLSWSHTGCRMLTDQQTLFTSATLSSHTGAWHYHGLGNGIPAQPDTPQDPLSNWTAIQFSGSYSGNVCPRNPLHRFCRLFCPDILRLQKGHQDS